MLYDITPPISSDLKVWPGDTPPRREVLLDMSQGDNLTLSTLHATVHLGAHADAPSHYGPGATSIEAAPLQRYLGPCRVVHVAVDRGARLTASQLSGRIDTERLLIATGTFPDPADFNEDFAALEPDLVDYLAAGGVKLVGVDTPSVDFFGAQDLPVHRRFLARNMTILEGLMLSSVPEGEYELIALPLPLVGFDASPVRAVLRTM